MRRAYHFEFCERPELPEWLRGDVFCTLAFVQRAFGGERVLAAQVPRFVRECDARRVIELGSGSGDGVACVARALDRDESSRSVEVIATDKFPRAASWREKLEPLSNAGFRADSVGFEDYDRVLPIGDLAGSALVLASAFHHLRERDARDFVARAASAGAHVIVIEPLERTWLGLAMGLGTGLAALVFPVASLLSSRERPGLGVWLRGVFFHWLVPIVPFILAHDGVVSALRQRTRAEWETLIEGLPFELYLIEKMGVLRNFSVLFLKRGK